MDSHSLSKNHQLILQKHLTIREIRGIIPTQDDRKNPERILTKFGVQRQTYGIIPTQDDRKNSEGILTKLARLRANLIPTQY